LVPVTTTLSTDGSGAVWAVATTGHSASKADSVTLRIMLRLPDSTTYVCFSVGMLLRAACPAF
jgi:hypothetical protein